jgi:type I restriction enzyme R subunit
VDRIKGILPLLRADRKTMQAPYLKKFKLSKELNEFLTRKQRIDVMLKEQGWVVGDRTKIIVEVDTKQSDFRAQNYKTVSETLKNDMESKYVDYLKLDRFGAQIAIIEAFPD